MYKIVKKEKLAESIDSFHVRAPLIANKAKAGQFAIIRIDEKGERIPLTIADYERKNGVIVIVSTRVGKTTALLSNLNQGDDILDVVGPLGNTSEIKKFGNVILVSGGVGAASILPITRAMKKASNYVISIIGAKSRDLIIFKNEIEDNSDEIYLCSDDGSVGYHGFVSGFLKEYLEERSSKSDGKKTGIARVVAVGPALMMRAAAEVTRPFNIKTIASLNSIMVDGTGMCGACRVEVGGETRFACVDGPEFDAHKVNFDLLLSRQRIYLSQEKKCMDAYRRECGSGK
ncbi:MAG: sulfide/dihydroorotate dehydrogenase-like FAD/NAD-binding protein [Actinomycetota bacterium]|nr:sulfide/dihydroorotate dehydrogenase-like FAD/NAD-binding protein [Actinomycetota bacterium]